MIQDVGTLIKEKVEIPNWLSGTPVIVNKETGELYKGTDAVNFISELNPSPKTNHKVDDVQDVEGVLPSGLTFCEDTEEPFGVFPEISDAPPNENKVTEKDLEEYMRQRNG